MLNNKGERELAYLVTIDEIRPIPGYDRVEYARTQGWWVIVRKDQFKIGDLAIYIEIDSKVPATEPFAFLEKRKYAVKTLKMCKVLSQGLLMSPSDFGWKNGWEGDSIEGRPFVYNKNKTYYQGDFLTKDLGITYYTPEDNVRKANVSVDKYKKMAARHPGLFRKPLFRWLMRRDWGKKLLFIFFGKKKDNKTSFPTKFPYIKKTDQERCENMPWVLNDKTPFIVTQKCDGSSATYILERKPFNRFEFYVCSRNVRQLTPSQKSFYDENYYWKCAIKYNIENKLKDYLKKHPNLKYVCWQGEICAPDIQKNPHGLSTAHLFCFHMIDSEKGKYDIREAMKIWKEYSMETVPIVNENYILPDDFEAFKQSADGFYEASCCEGATGHPREGFVYYKTTDPNFSFKNVSRKYLLQH